MSTVAPTATPRLLTPYELAHCVRSFRSARKWSQEQLAAISGVSVRTVQRVERGEDGSFDTRRALARAFEFDDVDAFNVPHAFLSPQELQELQRRFDRENVVVPVQRLVSGRVLASLAEECGADLLQPMCELRRDAAEEFAALVDYYRDYRDCAEDYTESQKLEVFEALQAYIDGLAAGSVSLYYGTRDVEVCWDALPAGASPPRIKTLYVMAYPAVAKVDRVAVPRRTSVRL